MRYCLILFFLLTAICSYSIDEVDDLLDQAKYHFEKDEWEKSNRLVEIAFSISVDQNYFLGKIRSIQYKGWIQHKSGDISLGVREYLEVVDLTNNTQDTSAIHFRIYAFMNLGTILENSGLFDFAESMLMSGIETCDLIGYDKEKHRLLNNLQRTLRQAGRFSEAVQVNQQILSISNRHSIENIKALNGLGIAHQLQGNFDLAEYYFKKLYNESIAGKFQKYEAFALHNLGDIFYDQKEYSKAIEYYLRAIEVKTNDIEADAEDKHTSHRDIAKAYAKNDQFDKAIFHAKIAEQYLSEITNCLECETKVYAVLGDLMKTQGDQTSQTYYSRKLAIASEKFANEQLEITYESKQPELREVVNGYYAELRSQQEDEASKKVLLSVIAGFVSLILILAAYHIYSRLKVRRILSAELEKLNWD